MPEYSSTTITPADGVQVPSMNGSTSGNFLLSALRDYILASKGQANGLASLGSDGKLTPSQLPDLADDVIVVASYAVLPATGTAGKLYITANNNKMYRWDSDLSTPNYVELSVDLSEYAKLTDLAAEETAREIADTNLNNAISQINHRVSNLEQAHGSYEVQNYKDGSTTPSGKGNWAVVEGLRGVSRVENNLLHDVNSWSAVSASKSVADGVVTFTRTGDNYLGYQVIPVVNGHKYILAIEVMASEACSVTFSNAIGFGSASVLANTWTKLYFIQDASFSSSAEILRVNAGVSNGETLKIKDKAVITDLSVYFGGTIPSDADTIAEIQTNYPHLLLPSDYGVRIVDWTGNGVESGIDLVNGSIDGSGNDTPSDSRVRSSFVPVSGAITIAIDNPSAGQIITEAHYYNSAKSWLSYEAVSNTSKTLTIPSSCKYLKFILRNSNQTTTTPLEWAGKLLINNVHIERFLGVLSFPSTSLKSAGSVYDSCELNVEVEGVARRRDTQRIGSVDLSTKNWSYNSGWNCWQSTAPSDIALPSSTTVVVNALWGGMIAVMSSGFTTQSNVGTFAINPNGIFFVNNGSTTVAPTGIMQYELADPVVTLSDPILDNTLLTESGGRMATVQTGTVVDGSFDMGFITL